MRIGIFTNNYLPNPYGVTQSIESFRKQFEAKGHQVFIFAPRWNGYKDENPNVFCYPSIDIEIKFRFPLAIPFSFEMNRVISKLDLDIIHAQHPNLLGTAAKKWARRKNIPLVFTWHTLYDQYTNFIPFIPKKWAAGYIIKKAVQFASKCDQIIVPTESVKEIIRDWGVVNANIEAISSGIEQATYLKPNGAAIRQGYGIKNDEKFLLLVSRLTEEKNIEFLFRAVAIAMRTDEKIKFLVAGDGYLVSKLKELVGRLSISDRVFFAGMVDSAVIKHYYAAADIFVYASKSETQGMIITEAMYMGLPIVAVRATGVCDLVESGTNGFLVSQNENEFADAVRKLASNLELRSEFGKESARIAREKYTSEVCAMKMLNVYNKLIGRQ